MVERPTLQLVTDEPVCAAQRTAPAVEAAPEYVWTERGIAVLVLLACCLFVLMGAAATHAFLSVSNAPLDASVPSAVVVPAWGR